MHFVTKILPIYCVLLFGLQLSAQSVLDQEVNIKIEATNLQDAFQLISQQTGIAFTYSKDIFVGERVVNIQPKTIVLRALLNKMLVKTNIHYREIGNQVVLYTKEIPNRKKIRLTGIIRSEMSLQPIELAYVYNNKNQKGTQSDIDGVFELLFFPDSLEIVVEALGFDKQTHQIFLKKSTQLNFDLKPTTQLTEIVITDSIYSDALPLKLSDQGIQMTEIVNLPSIGTEPDLERGLMLLPGVQAGNEGVSGLFVRGGSVDQNQLLLDGVSLYNPSHLLGIFSVFNMDIVKSAKFVKEGFPAQYGGRLSSFLDIKTISGDHNKFSGQGSLGLLSSRLSVSGPLNSGNTSLLFSGRQSHTNLLLAPYNKFWGESGGRKQTLNYYFFDVYAKIHHLFAKEKDEISLTFYNSNDNFSYRNQTTIVSEDETQDNQNKMIWGNQLIAFHWKHKISRVLTFHSNLSYTQYRFNAAELYEQRRSRSLGSISLKNYVSGINNFNAKLQGVYQQTPGYQLVFGVSSTKYGFTPGANALQLSNAAIGTKIDTTFLHETLKATAFNLYLNNSFKIGSNIKIEAGLRQSIFSSKGKNFASLEPRLSGKWRFLPGWDFHSSFSMVSQPVHLLTNTAIGLPTDIWIPSVDELHPEQSQLITGGLNYSYMGFFQINLDAYYKRQNNLVTYVDGAAFLLNSEDWEDKLKPGSGKSIGGELLLRYSNKKLVTWASYTLSKTDRQFSGVNGGKEFPFKYDRRHDFSWAMMYQLTKRIKFSLTWVYGSGNAFTAPTGKILVDGSNGVPADFFVYEYGERNAERMPNFHRMNLGIDFYKKKKRIERTIRISIYNLYNKRNPFFTTIGYNEEKGTDEFQLVSIFPIIPSLSFDFKF